MSSFDATLRSAGRWVRGTVPHVDGPVLSLWDAYLRLYPHVVNRPHALRIGPRVPFEPFKVVSVDPDRIAHMVEYSALPAQARERTVFDRPKYTYAGAVRSGDWDRTDRRFEDSDIYRSFEAHFARDVPWAETPFFRTAIKHIQRGTELWGCETRADFEARCRSLDVLFESIRRNGYRSQRELAAATADDLFVEEGPSLPFRVRLVNHEIAVCIGRDGEFLFKDGRNRLAIAKVLDLDAIPVWLMLRHEEWHRRRDAIAAGLDRLAELEPDLRTHPDLVDLEPGNP